MEIASLNVHIAPQNVNLFMREHLDLNNCKTRQGIKMGKSHVLLAMAGYADKMAAINFERKHTKVGPIAIIPTSEQYNFINKIIVIDSNTTIFSENDDFDNNQITIDSYIRWLQKVVGTKVKIEKKQFIWADINEKINADITDFGLLHNKLKEIIDQISEEYKEEDSAEYYIQTSSGINQIQLIWPLLKNRLKNVTLLKSSIAGTVSTVNFPFNIQYDYIPEDAKSPVGSKEYPYILEYSCAAMKEVVEFFDERASFPNPVLLLGETGTGKEMVARRIHEKSGRSGKFIAINCGALPDTLLESTLFGVVKGAFTGAEKDTIGEIEKADGGTLFLDEIGDMPLNQQVKLLRVLDDKKVQKVGAIFDKHIKEVDFRLITATNKDLLDEIANNNFREDLYYRIACFQRTLPGLRVRDFDDIFLIAKKHLKIAEDEMRKNKISLIPSGKKLSIKEDAITELNNPKNIWKGNVRELANVIKRAASNCVIKGRTEISKQDIIDNMFKKQTTSKSEFTLSDETDFSSIQVNTKQKINMEQILENIEKHCIDKYLSQYNGKIKDVDQYMGYNKNKLQNKCKSYSIKYETYKTS